MNEPTVITKGDSVIWTREVPDYPSPGWVLSYAFVKEGEHHVFQGADNGDGAHVLALQSTDTDDLTAGVYHWQAYVSDGVERVTIDRGRTEVKPDFASATTGLDARTHVEKVLEALESAIEGRASNAQSAIDINGRSIRYMAPDELIRWRNHYRRELRREQQAERLGQATGFKNIRVRF